MSDAPALALVGDMAVVAHKIFSDRRGSLVPIEVTSAVPFTVARLFWVFDVPEGHVRGGHAHRMCSQYLLCMRGAVEVVADDGESSATLRLEAGSALLVPPAIWASERYLTRDTTLLVLCDRPYEAGDYIDEIDAVRAFRGTRSGETPMPSRTA